MRSTTTFAIAAAALWLATGCSISNSITSPSRWIADSSGAIADSSRASAGSSNAASESSSGSSGGGSSSDSAYRDDVRVATRAFATSSGASDAAPETFARQLGRIGARHGISHWAGEPGTWTALGAGLREAGREPAEADLLARSLGARTPADLERVRAGYRAAAL